VIPPPVSLIAELTHDCPLHCLYCSNPLRLVGPEVELDASEWQRVIQDAAALGVLQLHLSGGEPLLRCDLESLVAEASDRDVYTNLITSALGLTRDRLQQLQQAGLDNVQISFQSDEERLADAIAGKRAHTRKRQAAQMVREAGMPLAINMVLHRRNIARLPEMISLAEECDAQRLELAHTQFLGWAFKNRGLLLPTRLQVEEAEKIATAAQKRLRGKMEVLYVLPDYYLERPKPCMYGWGRRYLTVNPYGYVMPCQTASVIPSLRFDNVRQQAMRWIWTTSEAFRRFRGTAWMPEPCQSCPRREIDFGGCRCQAFLLTGDETNTDPVCDLSPYHQQLVTFTKSTQSDEVGEGEAMTLDGWVHRVSFRTNPTI